MNGLKGPITGLTVIKLAGTECSRPVMQVFLFTTVLSCEGHKVAVPLQRMCGTAQWASCACVAPRSAQVASDNAAYAISTLTRKCNIKCKLF